MAYNGSFEQDGNMLVEIARYYLVTLDGVAQQFCLGIVVLSQRIQLYLDLVKFLDFFG